MTHAHTADPISSDPGPTGQAAIDSYWSTYASEYDSHQRRRLAEEGEVDAWERVWAHTLPAAPCDVLDVGTGTGHAALILAGLGHRVTGVDSSEGMLREARIKAQRVTNAPTFVRADASELPFARHAFDAITARFALWTIRDPEGVLAHWRTVLRPGGRLVVVDALWFPQGLLNDPAASDRDTRSRAFHDAYAGAVEDLPLARATDIGAYARVIAEAGFSDVVVDELPEIMERDRRHGVAPKHAVQMNYRITARV